jgi:nickel/cobalt transporter (NiCoT) family protein
MDVWPIVLLSIPTMIVLGLRHGVDIDHITAIDNLVRLHNANKKSRWVGASFSSGHMISVLAEMIFIIYLVGGIINLGNIAFWGSIMGAVALGTIAVVNVYSMKKWGKSSSAILASKILVNTGVLGTSGSAFVTGLVFGLGFDTATQISAISLSVVASATAGISVALSLAGFFALGMIPIDTLDSVLLRSILSKILHAKGFKYMSYALSGVALLVAIGESYGTLIHGTVMPIWIGAVLAVGIIMASFAYGLAARRGVMSQSHNLEPSSTELPEAPRS